MNPDSSREITSLLIIISDLFNLKIGLYGQRHREILTLPLYVNERIKATNTVYTLLMGRQYIFMDTDKYSNEMAYVVKISYIYGFI